MKKLLLCTTLLIISIASYAQFEQDKLYFNGSLSGLSLNYNGKDKLNMGIQAEGGYFVEDNWLVKAQAGFNHFANNDIPDKMYVGAGVRYYIIQNGLYLGANCKLVHGNKDYNDIMPGFEVGYAFFLSRTVTLEPAIYYDQSLKKHSDYSTIGLRIGVGIYLE